MSDNQPGSTVIISDVPFPGGFYERLWGISDGWGNDDVSLEDAAKCLGAGFVTADRETVRDILRAGRILKETRRSVLILGDMGTGKEVAAKAVANLTGCSGRYVARNCVAFPESLLDNELFGHEPGAYTDARETFRGVFEQAEGGTVFLDEIGETSTAMQAKLLRVLQERKITRLGGEEEIDIDVQVITATNRNLDAMMQEDDFREDLYNRLNTVQVTLRPLSQRFEDRPLLLWYFIHEWNTPSAESKRPKPSDPITHVSEHVLYELVSHHWPGNARELQQAIEAQAADSGSNTLSSLQTLHDSQLRYSGPPADLRRTDVLVPIEDIPERLEELKEIWGEAMGLDWLEPWSSDGQEAAEQDYDIAKRWSSSGVYITSRQQEAHIEAHYAEDENASPKIPSAGRGWEAEFWSFLSKHRPKFHDLKSSIRDWALQQCQDKVKPAADLIGIAEGTMTKHKRRRDDLKIEDQSQEDGLKKPQD